MIKDLSASGKYWRNDEEEKLHATSSASDLESQKKSLNYLASIH